MMPLRCPRCGFYYGNGRRWGDLCGDRSISIKEYVRGEVSRVTSCPGRLVTRREYRQLQKSNP